MKWFISIIFIICFSCSCARTGRQAIVYVPDQKVSFISPPSNWERLFFTSTSQIPTGETVPKKVFIATWRNSDLSAIGISGTRISGQKIWGRSRPLLRYAINEEIDELKKVCKPVNYIITDEKSGSLREGIIFSQIEAEITCSSSGSDVSINLKTIAYVLDSSGYNYTLQFKAIDENYDKDIIVFRQILDSITFGGN